MGPGSETGSSSPGGSYPEMGGVCDGPVCSQRVGRMSQLLSRAFTARPCPGEVTMSKRASARVASKRAFARVHPQLGLDAHSPEVLGMAHCLLVSALVDGIEPPCATARSVPRGSDACHNCSVALSLRAPVQERSPCPSALLLELRPNALLPEFIRSSASLRIRRRSSVWRIASWFPRSSMALSRRSGFGTCANKLKRPLDFDTSLFQNDDGDGGAPLRSQLNCRGGAARPVAASPWP